MLAGQPTSRPHTAWTPLPACLEQVPIRVVYLDRSLAPGGGASGGGDVHVDEHDFIPEGCPQPARPRVHLLYRPGHYVSAGAQEGAGWVVCGGRGCKAVAWGAATRGFPLGGGRSRPRPMPCSARPCPAQQAAHDGVPAAITNKAATLGSPLTRPGCAWLPHAGPAVPKARVRPCQHPPASPSQGASRPPS